MAQALNKTKRRIASINSTKKITNAMELVSTVKLKKYRRVMEENDDYTNEIVNLINLVFKNRKEDEKTIYEKSNNASKDFFIVVSSNLGLCASFNNDIYKYVDNNVDKNTSVILIIGNKGNEYFKRNGYQVDESFVNLTDKYSYDDVIKLSRFLDSLIREEKYRSISLVYTHYVNSIRFKPELVNIFPLKISENYNELEYKPIFDPNHKTLIEELVPLYLSSILYQRIIESLVSEQASRRNAMESATDNANELIDNLTLEYNKARQASITQEITEVVSASLNK